MGIESSDLFFGHNQILIVLCYSYGDTVSVVNPYGHKNTSDAWDFVITSDDDPGGYMADVYIDTGDDSIQQLGPQGTSDALQQRLMSSSSDGPLGCAIHRYARHTGLCGEGGGVH